MNTLDDLRQQLVGQNITEVSKRTGLTRATIYNLIRGNDPRWSTVRALMAYFEKCEKGC